MHKCVFVHITCLLVYNLYIFIYFICLFPERNELSLYCIQVEKIHYHPSLSSEDRRFLLQGFVLFSIWLSFHFTLGKVCGKGEPTYSLFTVINKLLPNPEYFICTFRIKWITIIIRNPTLGHQLADATAPERTQ